MRIPAEVRELLSWDEALGERLAGLPVDQQRSVIHDALEQRAARTGLVVEQVAQGRRLHRPGAGDRFVFASTHPSATALHPAFLHIHGGGFILGSTHWVYNRAKCAHICRAAGCIVATIDYRLAPEFPFPTAPEDCYAALRWLVDHADDVGIDPTRVAVGGESAGGNLAAALALMTRDRSGPPLSLQLLEVPVTDMSKSSTHHPLSNSSATVTGSTPQPSRRSQPRTSRTSTIATPPTLRLCAPMSSPGSRRRTS